MKKLFAILLALTMIFALAACGEKDPAPSSSDDPGTSTATPDPGMSQPGGDKASEDESWDSPKFSAYTSGLPKPEFDLESGIEGNSMGEKFASFIGKSGTTQAQVEAYCGQLETAGLTISVSSDTENNYHASAETSDSSIIAELSYVFGQAKIQIRKVG